LRVPGRVGPPVGVARGRPKQHGWRLRLPRAKVALQAGSGSEGDEFQPKEEIDWDKEVAALVARQAGDKNRFYKALKSISPPELVREFTESAPKDVQTAVGAAVGKLFGNLPSDVAQSTITTTGRMLASLMFSMQMTGYMFRNAQYRKSLKESLESSAAGLLEAKKLPQVSGKITVRIAEGMEAEVDAEAYMSELRTEVEQLRCELAAARKEEDERGGLLAYLQSIGAKETEELTKDVSQDVLEAMKQVVSSLMDDMKVPCEDQVVVTSTADKLRELLFIQLVYGYKLREMAVRDELKDKFWS